MQTILVGRKICKAQVIRTFLEEDYVPLSSLIVITEVIYVLVFKIWNFITNPMETNQNLILTLILPKLVVSR